MRILSTAPYTERARFSYNIDNFVYRVQSNSVQLTRRTPCMKLVKRITVILVQSGSLQMCPTKKASISNTVFQAVGWIASLRPRAERSSVSSTINILLF